MIEFRFHFGHKCSEVFGPLHLVAHCEAFLCFRLKSVINIVFSIARGAVVKLYALFPTVYHEQNSHGNSCNCSNLSECLPAYDISHTHKGYLAKRSFGFILLLPYCKCKNITFKRRQLVVRAFNLITHRALRMYFFKH